MGGRKRCRRGEYLLLFGKGSNAEQSFCTQEETLEVEYIESVMPPQKMTSLPHEDWVSSISCQTSRCVHRHINAHRVISPRTFARHFLTSSYDGNVRLFDYSQNLIHTSPIHNAPITSVCAVPSNGSTIEDTPSLFATASHDLTARLTRITLKTDDTPAATRTLASLHLHTAPLTSIVANGTGTRLLSASWDSLLGVWDTIVPGLDEVPADPTPARQKKRRRLAANGDVNVRRKAPLAVLRSHTARVSRALFTAGGAQAVSAGFDASVRVWDIENEVCTHTVASRSRF